MVDDEIVTLLREIPTLDPGPAILTVRDLRVWFELRRWGFGRAGYVHAVDGISFELRRGEAIAVVGESGCGKSTLMKTLLGLYAPTGGQVLFDGTDLAADRGGALRRYHTRVGYVQQDPFGALPPFMTIEQILAEPLRVGGIRDGQERSDRIRRVMEEVKLSPVEDFLPKFPHMLSGGQQQRVVIARAMVMKPEFIVADEPVSMLDASVRVEILKLLRNLQETHNLSVIYITHDLATVSYFSERIFVMYAGQIVEKASVHELLHHPLHPYTLALLTATSEPDARNAEELKDVPAGEPPSLVHPPSGCRFHPRCPRAMPGLCDAHEPPEFEPAPGHLVSCWLYQ